MRFLGGPGKGPRREATMDDLRRQVRETVEVLAARWGYPRARVAVRRLIDEACGYPRRLLGEARRPRRMASSRRRE